MDVHYQKQPLCSILTISAVVTLQYFEFTSSYSNPAERHPFWELVYIDKGEMAVVSEEKTLLLKKDEIVFHKPNEAHALSGTGKIAPNVVVISFCTKSRSMKFLENKIIKLSPVQKNTLASILSEGMQAFLGPFDTPYKPKMFKNKLAPIGAQQALKNLLELFLIDLIQMDLSTCKTERMICSLEMMMDRESTNSMMLFLEKNISQHYTIGQLSSIFRLSKSALKQTFAGTVGMGPIHYHNYLKIQEAKRLIREEQLSISAIATILGFSSVHYFSRLFKKYTNMSPTAYRSCLKAKLEQ